MPYFHTDHRLFYREQGRGRLLLILPGNTASSAHHDGELTHFGKRYHAVALDFAGTGRSDRLARWSDDWWARGAGDAAALVAHLGYGRCVAVGTSGGGLVALWLAILHPERVAAVVADSCVERFPPGWLQQVVKTRNQRTPDQVAFWRAAHGDDWQQVVEADSDLFLRLAERGGDIFQGRLREIACPVLLTASQGDQVLPDAGGQTRHMLAQIPGSQAYLTREGEHPLMWSRPDDFRRVADGFLEGIKK